MNARLVTGLLVLSGFLGGCRSVPPPESLTAADAISESRSLQHAAKLAPQAFAHAEQLRGQADDAYDAGQLAASDALAERSIAAYQRALAQSRIATAAERVVAAEHQLDKTRSELSRLAKQQRRLQEQLKALDLQLKVIRDTEPPQAVQPDSPKREAARRTAAWSILEAGRLLCLAARMINPQGDKARQLAFALDDLEKQLGTAPRPTPIDQAMRLRAQCLGELTLARRPQQQQSPAQDRADAFLVELSRALTNLAPIRDDRGVVVAASNLFDEKGLSQSGQQLTDRMLNIAKANPDLPLLIVVHTTRTTSKFGQHRAELLQAEASKRGLKRTPVHWVGGRLPLSVVPVKGSKLKDDRVEFVFVSR